MKDVTNEVKVIGLTDGTVIMGQLTDKEGTVRAVLHPVVAMIGQDPQSGRLQTNMIAYPPVITQLMDKSTMLDHSIILSAEEIRFISTPSPRTLQDYQTTCFKTGYSAIDPVAGNIINLTKN